MIPYQKIGLLAILAISKHPSSFRIYTWKGPNEPLKDPFKRAF